MASIYTLQAFFSPPVVIANGLNGRFSNWSCRLCGSFEDISVKVDSLQECQKRTPWNGIANPLRLFFCVLLGVCFCSFEKFLDGEQTMSPGLRGFTIKLLSNECKKTTFSSHEDVLEPQENLSFRHFSQLDGIDLRSLQSRNLTSDWIYCAKTFFIYLKVSHGEATWSLCIMRSGES